jgi:hypothetical protein
MKIYTEYQPKRRTGLRVASAVAVGAIGITGGLALNNRDTRLGNEAAAHLNEIAEHRNTCHISRAEIVRAAGGLSLEVEIALAPGAKSLDSYGQEFSSLTTDTTFADETGNMVSGVGLYNKSRGRSLLTSEPGDGPATPVNHANVPQDDATGEPAFSPRDTFTVYRVNAVSMESSPLLAANHYDIQTGLVACGEITVNPDYTVQLPAA